MSIHDLIDSHIAAGKLHRIEAMADDSVSRSMVVSTEINTLLVGPWRSQSSENRAMRLLADLEHFVSGKQVSVSLEGFHHKTAYFGRLDKPEHEIWDIRSRDPKPGLRIFGRFADINFFVGLIWRPRSVEWEDKMPLGSGKSIEWDIEKIQCESAWNNLFPKSPPIHGGKICDYISDKAFPV